MELNDGPKMPKIPDGNDSYARVELFLWQYGELPSRVKENRPLNIDIALEKGSDNLLKACKENKPEDALNPVGVASVLKYLGKTYKFE